MCPIQSWTASVHPSGDMCHRPHHVSHSSTMCMIFRACHRPGSRHWQYMLLQEQAAWRGRRPLAEHGGGGRWPGTCGTAAAAPLARAAGAADGAAEGAGREAIRHHGGRCHRSGAACPHVGGCPALSGRDYCTSAGMCAGRAPLTNRPRHT